MTGNVNPQGTIAAEHSAAEQLEQHLAELPKSRQRTHTLLGVLALICGAASIGLNIWAIYVSIRASTFGLESVPFWWFIWFAVVSLFLALYGLATVVAESDPPFVLGRSQARMKFGHEVRRGGWLLTVGGLTATVAFAALATYVGVTGVDWFEYFITGVVIFSAGLGLVAAFASIIRALIRALRKGQ